MQGHGFQEIEAWAVPAGEDMGYSSPGNAERVRELGLGDVFRIQELLKALVHGDEYSFYKSNQSVWKRQILFNWKRGVKHALYTVDIIELKD
jgi:hypothetical protein